MNMDRLICPEEGGCPAVNDRRARFLYLTICGCVGMQIFEVRSPEGLFACWSVGLWIANGLLHLIV